MGGEITSTGGHLEEDRSPGLKAEPYYKSYNKLIEKHLQVNKTEAAL